MCQVDEEYNELLESRSLPGVSKKCMKCKEGTAVLIIRAGDAFCRSCFKEYFIHKFRAMLGKNRVIFPGEKVLLAVSGGLASSSMLAQVQEGLSQDAHKKLRFVPGIVYVDEGGASGQSLEERQRAASQLEHIFQATGFPYHIVPLEEVFSLPSSVLEAASAISNSSTCSYKTAVEQFIQNGGEAVGLRNKEQDSSLADAVSQLQTHDCQPSSFIPPAPQRQALERLFASVKTQTAKEELLQTLRQHLILHTARLKGYSKVMLGESCTRLAVKLLSSISLGRGAALAMDTGFADSRFGDVVLVRPMRDYSSKEIAFYGRLFSVPSVFTPGLDTKTSDKASIQRLTESFVTNLQTGFPSTVSTIYRTSEKLQTAHSAQTNDAEPASKCLLCLCALDTTVEEASAFNATLLSERLSQGKKAGGAGLPTSAPAPSPAPALGSGSAGQCCSSSAGSSGDGGCGGGGGGGEGEGGGCCSGSSGRPSVNSDLKSLLCYSCRLTIKDMTTVDTLPSYLMSEAERRKRRVDMRKEISEFLLEEDED
ncbi:cytoplasmic tRNA 2-thiolation protein 2 [Clupea harengus]|uniref:Cytoplasmic tRNA 2-thiolation protein 2 n=1 Tax=Clupea harengus TaxID=7950 RepID=A0A6P8FNE7_CLUHA|nr:cytoplasmic tRNA 2-thiolation protein 2 [Clupea harengus]